jgi:hypothetical protein
MGEAEQIEDVIEESAPSLADELASAWDESEETGGDDSGDIHQAKADESGDGDAASAAAAAKSVDKQPDAEDVSDLGAGAGDAAKSPEAGGEASEKPPISWNAEARETWSKIPKEAQAYIHERERQAQQRIHQSAEGAKRAQAMDQLLRPYEQYLSMNGGPGQAINTLLQAGANLQMGSPVQKAQMVAQLISQYGVDINTLDNILVGEKPPEHVQQQTELQRAVQEAVAPYQQMMQQYQQSQQHQVQQFQGQIQQTLQQFSSDPANEFYNDVKMDMADILDMAAQRGVEMDLKTAYDRACKLNDGISRIIETRQQASETAGKRRAAVSIHGNAGAGGGSARAGDDIRSSILDAWDNSDRV